MKKILTIVLFASLLSVAHIGCSSSSNTANQATQTEPTNSSREGLADTSRNLIIYYDAAIGKEALLQASENYGAKLLHDYQSLHGIAIQLPSDKPIDHAISHFKAVNGVLSVDRDQAMQIN